MRKLLLLILILAGFFDALYLQWVYTSPNHPLVCLGTGCDVVRASRYASLWGRALPDYGLLMYTVLLVVVLLEAWLAAPAVRRWAQASVVLIAAGGFAFSLYLTYLEGFVIHAWCAWCVGSAVIITLIFLLSLADLRVRESSTEESRFRLRKRFVLVVVLMAAIETLAFRYLISRPPEAPTDAGQAPPEVLDQRLVRPNSHAIGNLSAPVTVVEFGDFECPGCGRVEPQVEEMLAQYGNRVRFVFRQFPLSEIHPYAETAAEASECAAEQGKFWQAERKFYQDQDDLTEPALDRYASELGLDLKQFDQCLAAGTAKARIESDLADGKAVKVGGTPTFFVGHQKFFNVSFDQILQALNQQLAAAGSGGAPGKGTAQSNAAANPGGGGFGSFGASSGTSPFGGASELACSPDELKKQQPTLIHTSDVQQLLQSGSKPLILDVRPAAQFKSGHLPAARSMPVDQIETAGSGLPKDKTLVLYESGKSGASASDVCAVSRAGARMLLSQGFDYSKVRVYQDGLAGWEKAGLPVEK